LSDEVREFLFGPEPQLRAATALGLARATRPAATGLLAARYEVESEPVVRRAIAYALANRSGPLGRSLLLDIARFDPDSITRHLASSARNADTTPSAMADPFLRASTEIDSAGTSAQSQRVDSVDSAPSAALAFRPQQASIAPTLVVSSPLGRALKIALDPRGLLLIAGETQQLAILNVQPSQAAGTPRISSP
jgi:hypothetical protein